MTDDDRSEPTGDGGPSDERRRTRTGAVDRRRLLGLVGSTGAVALAGCTIDEDGIRFSSGDDGSAGETEPGDGDDTGAEDDDEPDTDGGAGDDEDGDEPGDETEDDEEAEDGEDYPEPSFDEDCITLDPTNLSISEIPGGRWRIESGSSALFIFDTEAQAERAREILEFYGFDRLCFVGRPDPPMLYLTVDGTSVSAAGGRIDGDEDCLPVDPTNLSVHETDDGRWRLQDGRSYLVTDEDEAAIWRAKSVIEHYEFTTRCFHERPDPGLEYWLTD